LSRGDVLGFTRWLEGRLAEEPFGLITIGDVIAGAMQDLGLERGDVLRHMAALTARGGRFVSDGQHVREEDELAEASPKKASAP
jgi:hypothetical protein